MGGSPRLSSPTAGEQKGKSRSWSWLAVCLLFYFFHIQKSNEWCEKQLNKSSFTNLISRGRMLFRLGNAISRLRLSNSFSPDLSKSILAPRPNLVISASYKTKQCAAKRFIKTGKGPNQSSFRIFCCANKSIPWNIFRRPEIWPCREETLDLT